MQSLRRSLLTAARLPSASAAVQAQPSARCIASSARTSAPAATPSAAADSSAAKAEAAQFVHTGALDESATQSYRRPRLPMPEVAHADLHGSVHRVAKVRAVVPAQLTPEEQGTGANFIPTLLRPAEWIKKARRTGLLGTKLGMMQLWDHHGVRLPITVIKVDSQVIGMKNVLSPRGLLGLQVGTGRAKLKNTHKAMLVHCAKNGVAPPRKIVEFAVTPDAMLPLGWRFNVRHFVPGQFVDVTGTSIGKGFQGGMKKWGFGGLNASHGVSVTHRSIGATGSRQDPGKVFKGKKMPGRMGGKRVTKQNNKLFKIDVKNNLLFVVGTLPGNKGNYLIIKDAVKRPWNPETPPPFPTHRPQPSDEEIEEIVCAPEEADPFAFGVA